MSDNDLDLLDVEIEYKKQSKEYPTYVATRVEVKDGKVCIHRYSPIIKSASSTPSVVEIPVSEITSLRTARKSGGSDKE